MVFVEKSAIDLPLTQLVSKTVSDIKVVDSAEEVENIKKNIVITSKRDNFVHACPATNIYRCCNYHVMDIMQGCPFDCSYCILQAYLPHKHIRVSGDVDTAIKSAIEATSAQKRRIGTGELSDSLALDNIIPLTKLLLPFANNHDSVQFEFKTKSANVANLLTLNPKNIVVSWSLNPREIWAKEEPLTASIDKRLKAMEDCIKHGYRVGIHFDPLIYTDDFEKYYGNLLDELFERIDSSKVEFISVSTFRATDDLMDAIRLRQSNSILTKGDYVKGIDGKIRYFKALRMKMMSYVVNRLRHDWSDVFVYLCMEHETTWQSLMGYDTGDREQFEQLFPYYNKF